MSITQTYATSLSQIKENSCWIPRIMIISSIIVGVAGIIFGILGLAKENWGYGGAGVGCLAIAGGLGLLHYKLVTNAKKKWEERLSEGESPQTLAQKALTEKDQYLIYFIKHNYDKDTIPEDLDPLIFSPPPLLDLIQPHDKDIS